MAFNTYTDLKTAIANWLNRDDLTTYLDDFIKLAEDRLAREIRIRATEKDLSVTMASGLATVPTDFLELKHAYIDGTPVFTLEPKDSQWIYRKYPNRSSQSKPEFIGIDGANFVFAPFPDSNYDVKGVYHFKPAALSSTNATNEWTDNVPDALLFAALIETAPFLNNDIRMEVWERKYAEKRDGYMRAEKRERRRGARMSYN